MHQFYLQLIHPYKTGTVSAPLLCPNDRTETMRLNTSLSMLVCVFLASCLDRERQTIHAAKDSHYVIQLIEERNGGYGFQIIENGAVRIHHPHIPSKTFDIAFVSRQQATKVAVAVVEQLKRNELPPTITQAELEGFSMIVAK